MFYEKGLVTVSTTTYATVWFSMIRKFTPRKSNWLFSEALAQTQLAYCFGVFITTYEQIERNDLLICY